MCCYVLGRLCVWFKKYNTQPSEVIGEFTFKYFSCAKTNYFHHNMIQKYCCYRKAYRICSIGPCLCVLEFKGDRNHQSMLNGLWSKSESLSCSRWYQQLGSDRGGYAIVRQSRNRYTNTVYIQGSTDMATTQACLCRTCLYMAACLSVARLTKKFGHSRWHI